MKISKPKQIKNLNKAIYIFFELEETTKPKRVHHISYLHYFFEAGTEIHDLIALIL
jgi:hypothetical protein